MSAADDAPVNMALVQDIMFEIMRLTGTGYHINMKYGLCSKASRAIAVAYRRKNTKMKKKMKGDPKSRQLYALFWIEDKFNLGKRSVACILETSFGKTIIAMEMALNNISKGNVVIVTPHTASTTWVEELEKFYERFIVPPRSTGEIGMHDVIYYMSDKKLPQKKWLDSADRSKVKNKLIIVSGDAKGYTGIISDLKPYMLIVDEPHRLEKRNEILNSMAKANGWRVLLLDATAPKGWDIDISLYSNNAVQKSEIPEYKVHITRSLDPTQKFIDEYDYGDEPYSVVLGTVLEKKLIDYLSALHGDRFYKIMNMTPAKMAKFLNGGGVMYSTISRMAESINISKCDQMHLIDTAAISLPGVRQVINRVLRTSSKLKQIDIHIHTRVWDIAQYIRARLSQFNISGVDVDTEHLNLLASRIPPARLEAMTAFELMMVFCKITSHEARNIQLPDPKELTTITFQEFVNYKFAL